MSLITTMAIASPKTIIRNAKRTRANRRYEKMIAESQAKLAETTLVPGVVQIYA